MQINIACRFTHACSLYLIFRLIDQELQTGFLFSGLLPPARHQLMQNVQLVQYTRYNEVD